MSKGLVLVLALAVVATGAALWVVRGTRRPEDVAAARLHAAVLDRAGEKGLFGYAMGQPPDVWSTGEAGAALAAYGDRSDMSFVRRMVDYTIETRLQKLPPGYENLPHGGWPIDPKDTIGAGEPTGWTATAIALARWRIGDAVAKSAEEVERLLLALQNPDGSFSSVFVGPEAARTSATQDCLLALICHAAVQREPGGELLDAVEKACSWFGATFDARARVWYPRVRHGWKAQTTVPGCSETTVWLLLEARDLLREHGRDLPTAARKAVEAFAEGFRPDHRDKLTIAMPADRNDYLFDLPEGYTTTWGRFGHRWSWYPYRVLAVTRLANTPGFPRKPEWQREETWLRERLLEFTRELDKLPTFQLSESLLMASILRARPPGHPRRGSLVDLIRQGR